MRPTSAPSVVLSGLSFAWPDHADVLCGIDAAFGAGRTGLIGTNGAGKTTLLRLIAGELAPTAGTIRISGRVGYLPQEVTLRTEETVGGLLGVRDRLAALRAIESGDPDPEHFDVVGDDWGVHERARAILDGIGLTSLDLDRDVAALSGGETVLVALAGLRLRGPEVVVLDEPTNNLDRESRRRLYQVVRAWRGAVIVVSHDVALLDLMDDTAELRSGSLTTFGGPYSAYREYVARDQAATEQAMRTAEQALRAERRQRVEAESRLAHRQRSARADRENKRKPKIMMNRSKAGAEVSAGKLRGALDDKVDAARLAVARRAERVRSDARIRIELPDPAVPAGRRLAELADGRGTTVVIQGPERVALTGRNGVGKTRLLERLVHPELSGGSALSAVRRTERIGYLPQRLDHLDDGCSILDAVREAAPTAPIGEMRENLARFLFRADTVHRMVGELSGGERFRVALARLLLADPPNQLLVLDEPTNNLDLASIDELVDALDAYRGGLIAVSHDDAFLARLGIDTWLTLDEDGLHAGGPPPSATGIPPPDTG